MGAYRLLQRLNSPATFLEPYAARQLGAHTNVFLKRILSQRPGLKERLGEIIRQLRGPGIPACELAEDGTALWVKTDGGEGESLRWVMSALIRQKSFIAPNEGLAVVARVAASLATLHQQKLTHGDVCPSTFFISPRGEVQLHDGGLAQALASPEDPSRTEGNSLAPEQLKGPSTGASDIFRLGLVLFELSVGRPLFSGTSAQVCQSVASWQGLDPERIRQVPEPWLSLLVAMLNPHPEPRPSAEHVVSVLNKTVAQQGWSTSETDISRLMSRAGPQRAQLFPEMANGPEVHLTTVSTQATSPLVTPPSVLGRIATKKMSRQELGLNAEKKPEPADPQNPEERAAQLLIERGFLTAFQLNAARETVANGLASFCAALTSEGVKEDIVVGILGELTRTPTLTSKKMNDAAPTAEALGLIPLTLSLETRSVPLALKGNSQLLVAMVDPMDAKAVAALKSALGPLSLIAFRAGEQAISQAQTRLYQGAPGPWGGTFELEAHGELLSPTVASSPPQVEVLTRVVDALLALQGPKGGQAQALVALATGLARRMHLSPEDVTLAQLATQAMVTSALASRRPPHDVPPLIDVQECIGFDSPANAFVEALHALPQHWPSSAVHSAVVLAFAFSAHAGEAKPRGPRLNGALATFRAKHQLPQALLEVLTNELSG